MSMVSSMTTVCYSLMLMLFLCNIADRANRILELVVRAISCIYLGADDTITPSSARSQNPMPEDIRSDFNLYCARSIISSNEFRSHIPIGSYLQIYPDHTRIELSRRLPMMALIGQYNSEYSAIYAMLKRTAYTSMQAQQIR